MIVDPILARHLARLHSAMEAGGVAAVAAQVQAIRREMRAGDVRTAFIAWRSVAEAVKDARRAMVPLETVEALSAREEEAYAVYGRAQRQVEACDVMCTAYLRGLLDARQAARDALESTTTTRSPE